MIVTDINVELTDRCNKSCAICGRRKREKEHPEIINTYGDMQFRMVKEIAAQLPPTVTVHLHNNGEAFLYPRLKDAIMAFKERGCMTHITTNGKLLMEKFGEIVDVLDTLAISVIEYDPEWSEQRDILKEFLDVKGERKPHTVLRLNGDVRDLDYRHIFGIPLARRQLHAPEGSFRYEKPPTIPETGVCLDLLHHPAINKDGDVSICVRYDPERLGVLGNVQQTPLDEILYGSKRRGWIDVHYHGNRENVPLCRTCEYFGVPTY
jgi:radical SAM protein with 4Fe4S-binding SPASM domain